MQRRNTWKGLLAALLASSLVGGQTAWAATVDLTLNGAIEQALATNPSGKIAEAEKQQAQGALRETRAGRLPTVDFSHTASRRGGETTASRHYYDNMATLSLPLYTGGQVEGLIGQAELSLHSAELGVDKARQQLKLSATTGYYDVLQAGKLVQVDKESVERLAAHLQNVQAQYNVGTVAKSDVLRSEVELANAKQTLIKAENSREVAVSSLNNVIGLPLDTALNLKEELSYQQYGKSMGESIAYALRHRPEVQQADDALDSARKGVDVAQSGHRPTVNFSAYNDWNDTDFPGSDNSNWRMAVVANWNVFDSGLVNAKVSQAEAKVLQAQEEARQTRDTVQLEVRQAYLNMLEAEKRIDTTQVAVVQAEEDYKIAQVRYSAGVGTNLDVMDSQVALTQAKTNYIQALYDYNTSRATLENAMGMAVAR